MAALADWLGVPLSDTQHSQLETFGRWLTSEALTAGGIGPNEADRIFDRHVGDALMYLSQLPTDAQSIVDVGSGVGLPGIPMAIARPDLAVTLLDRAARRVDLARRASRVAGVGTVSHLLGDVEDLEPSFDVAVFRASLPPIGAAGVVSRVVTLEGRGILGASRRSEPPEPLPPVDGVDAEMVRLAPPMLASPAWFLRMHRSAE